MVSRPASIGTTGARFRSSTVYPGATEEICVPILENISGLQANFGNDENTNLLPLFLTQWNHREWGLIGVSRGYVSMIYPGSDTRDASPLFQNMYQKP